jgi:hypothetical protein
MIEKTIIGRLESAQVLPVYAEKPVEPPEAYILVEKTGGAETNHIRSATVAVQSVCRGSLLQACQLAEEHRKLMLDLVKEDNVFHCSVNSGPYNFTDPETKEYRYQTVYNIFYK